jgi:hypothetical protein
MRQAVIVSWAPWAPPACSRSFEESGPRKGPCFQMRNPMKIMFRYEQITSGVTPASDVR